MEEKICQIVVTYNRKELLFRNLNAVLRQNHMADILIYDNASTDGTYDFLKENGIVDNNRVHYYCSEKNIGGAGGFSKGLKMAYQMGYTLFWLMDDDGYCVDEHTLDELVKSIPENSKEFILNSTVVCDDEKNLTFGFLNIATYRDLLTHSKEGKYIGYINPFNSTLISKECLEKIGFPKGEFFIYGDEHEYMLRAVKSNVFVATVVSSLYYHPVNRTVKYEKHWKYDIPIKSEPVWKTFCDVRNNIFISTQYDGWKMTLIRIYIYITAARLKENKKLTYIKYTMLGIMDGLTGKFSRPIMFDK